MKSLQLIAIFLIILSVGYFVQSNNLLQNNNVKKTISGKADNSRESVNVTINPSPDDESNESLLDTNDEEEIMESNLSAYYPGSVVQSRHGSTVTLRSPDSADVVTYWYETYIRNNNMKTKTFVKTKTNGVIQNKLTGVNNNEEIAVDIQKEQDSDTIINIQTKSY